MGSPVAEAPGLGPVRVGLASTTAVNIRVLEAVRGSPHVDPPEPAKDGIRAHHVARTMLEDRLVRRVVTHDLDEA